MRRPLLLKKAYLGHSKVSLIPYRTRYQVLKVSTIEGFHCNQAVLCVHSLDENCGEKQLMCTLIVFVFLEW